MAMDLGKSGVRSDINITPLVDVVLVLLIIFMVVTPMLQRGKSVELPKARHASAGPQGEPAFVSVTKDGSVYIEQDKKPATQEEVIAALKGAAEAGKRVMVKADAEAEYGKVRPVLDWASKAKLKGVSLAAEELKGAK
jgi:biopolymer transport protein ExbD/biopolymer transport protein TolR